MLRRPLPDRLMPLASRVGLRPFYGDIHNHCGLSYGHGRPEVALARAALQLDFVSLTGHAHWPDMPVDVPEVAHIVDFHIRGFDKLRRGWRTHFDLLRQADVPGQFTVFPGYEIHSSAQGDYTIILADLATAPLVLADDVAQLKVALENAFGDRAFAFPHHIGYRQGARGISWESFDPALSPFVEILSMHGCAERSNTDRPYLHSMGPLDGYGTMERGLALGKVFGVVGNTDHHSGFPGSYGHGRMAVYATSPDREALWEAMRARRTNALSGDNIHLLAVLAGAPQGSLVAPPLAGTQLEIEAVGGSFIDAIDVVRNGRLFARITPEIAPRPVEMGNDDEIETLLFLEMGWGERGGRHRWNGWITVEGGEVLSVEPRLRGAEIVSPLDGGDIEDDPPLIEASPHGVEFAVTAAANPNSSTASTQGIMLRVRVKSETIIRTTLSGKEVEVGVERLLDGAVSGNLGAIDSPAFRFHRLPLPHQWQWAGNVDLGQTRAGETLYVRLRQAGGQVAYTSPIFVRSD